MDMDDFPSTHGIRYGHLKFATSNKEETPWRFSPPLKAGYVTMQPHVTYGRLSEDNGWVVTGMRKLGLTIMHTFGHLYGLDWIGLDWTGWMDEANSPTIYFFIY
jgi:hypothetical protein